MPSHEENLVLDILRRMLIEIDDLAVEPLPLGQTTAGWRRVEPISVVGAVNEAEVYRCLEDSISQSYSCEISSFLLFVLSFGLRGLVLLLLT